MRAGAQVAAVFGATCLLLLAGCTAIVGVESLSAGVDAGAADARVTTREDGAAHRDGPGSGETGSSSGSRRDSGKPVDSGPVKDAAHDSGADVAPMIDASALNVPIGGACDTDPQCTSGTCVAHLCCTTACTDQGAGACATNGQCNTTGTGCATYPAGTSCGTNQQCSGGSCQCVSSCGGNDCGGDGCGGSCGTCDSSSFCSGGSCQAFTIAPCSQGLGCGGCSPGYGYVGTWSCSLEDGSEASMACGNTTEYCDYGSYDGDYSASCQSEPASCP
jgi:hypothetical protein